MLVMLEKQKRTLKTSSILLIWGSQGQLELVSPLVGFFRGVFCKKIGHRKTLFAKFSVSLAWLLQIVSFGSLWVSVGNKFWSQFWQSFDNAWSTNTNTKEQIVQKLHSLKTLAYQSSFLVQHIFWRICLSMAIVAEWNLQKTIIQWLFEITTSAFQTEIIR